MVVAALAFQHEALVFAGVDVAPIENVQVLLLGAYEVLLFADRPPQAVAGFQVDHCAVQRFAFGLGRWRLEGFSAGCEFFGVFLFGGLLLWLLLLPTASAFFLLFLFYRCLHFLLIPNFLGLLINLLNILPILVLILSLLLDAHIVGLGEIEYLIHNGIVVDINLLISRHPRIPLKNLIHSR